MNSQNKLRIPISFQADVEDATSAVACAMNAARAAQSRWAATPIERRLDLVRELRHLIATHAVQLAEASAAERERPVTESLTAEVLPLADACRFAERKARAVLAPQRKGFRGRPAWLSGVQSEIRREPFGVVLVIGPGNYPLLLPGVQAIQALAAGNAVLLKPGAGGTRAAKALQELILRAGFAPGLIAVLPENTEATLTAIAARPDKVIFTGSASTGELILAQLAPHLVPAAMELSGCDAALVCADADLVLTVKALAFGLRLNNGATCLSPKRVFVHRSVATELEGRLAQEFRSSRFRDAEASARRGKCQVTPASERLRPLLTDALAQGAHLIAGGISNDGSIKTPVIIAGVSPDSRLLFEDVFLPVLALVTVADENEAVQRINECPFALGASVFTRDEIAARNLAARCDVGTVSINDLIVPTADPRLPFGGCKRSGFGATRGAEGLLELTRPKVVTRTRGAFRPAFDPPHPGDESLVENYLRLVHACGFKLRLSALHSLVRNLLSRKNINAQEGP
jgi:acyl-CoA reductase-like NAD-dependent aldehyde dehydrogenase